VFGLPFPWLRLSINGDKNGLGYILGVFFHQLIWSPCLHASSLAMRLNNQLFLQVVFFSLGRERQIVEMLASIIVPFVP
jgi:hypothetical protein